MIKYPKTPRLSSDIYSSEYLKTKVIVEEKVDGANVGISFDNSELILQSRGHILRGGPKEQLFERLWPWAYERFDLLHSILGNRYLLFGEWLYGKHRIFYDALPDYFLAFDIFDKEQNIFLPTTKWCKMLSDIYTVNILWEGSLKKAPAFGSLINSSKYKTINWKNVYDEQMISLGQFYSDTETDMTDLMEGVYIKFEDEEKVIGRVKLLREFFEKIRTDDSRWGRRPVFPNKLLTR